MPKVKSRFGFTRFLGFPPTVEGFKARGEVDALYARRFLGIAPCALPVYDGS